MVYSEHTLLVQELKMNTCILLETTPKTIIVSNGCIKSNEKGSFTDETLATTPALYNLGSTHLNGPSLTLVRPCGEEVHKLQCIVSL